MFALVPAAPEKIGATDRQRACGAIRQSDSRKVWGRGGGTLRLRRTHREKKQRREQGREEWREGVQRPEFHFRIPAQTARPTYSKTNCSIRFNVTRFSHYKFIMI